MEITTDGVTVWVNSPKGECLGRFGRMGIDIHVPYEQQLQGKQCLFCTHEPVTREDWTLFRQKMLKFHAVPINDDLCPRRLRHKHDCEKCLFLGICGSQDLYFCRQKGLPTVIARRSSDPPDYISGLEFAHGIIPILSEAFQRAQDRGLLS